MSLKGDKYETADEVKMRLEQTVVLYEGKPVYITKVSSVGGGLGYDAEDNPIKADDKKEIARVFFRELPMDPRIGNDEKNTHRKYLSSRNFDLSPFKMGYFNIKGRAIFAARSPIRQNRQGLSSQVLKLTDIKGRPVEDISFTSAISSKGFVDMVAGVYPTFKDVGDLLGDDENSSMAVSRCFALGIDHDLELLHLLHKGVRCGIAMKGDKGLRLPAKFHFLKQEAEECRIPLA